MDGTVNQGTCLKLSGFTAGRGVRKRTPGQSVSPPAQPAVFPKTLFSDSLRSRRRELNTPSILIIGGGIVGLATARQLLRQHPGAEVTVLEKEPTPGQHQTAHNSGVLHCGLYYTPGSLKARLAVEGIREMAEFCEEHNVPHEICGKLVVATNDAEVARMEKLFERGQANGLEGIEKLNRNQMREIEPNVGGIAALKVPQEGIADYPAVIVALTQEIEKTGGKVVTNARATGFREGSEWTVETPAGDFSADWIINCAGLHCDRVSQLAGQKRDLRIVPFRGEYFQLKPESQHLVRHLIYPVPDPQFPFLGVHFTRLINGGIEAGPNAVLAFAREGYRKTNLNFHDLYDALTYSGLWRFAFKYPKMCVNELRGSFSKKYFCKQLQKLVPEIQPSDLEPGGAGVRAQAMSPEGGLVQDFHFARGTRALHVLNAPSPAATASLAIGTEIINQLEFN
ncbi:MAG: L-2-hydroxyglutarate oxidase [Verrucomicrobia subdivision 3 bacterium]|nr:L-2-hydroxyglutarate oxidase [Limisphaerales bacterium]